MSANTRRDLLSNNEAINIALLNINKLEQVAGLHRIMTPTSLLANLRCHFTDLGTQHSSLLRNIERCSIANRKLTQRIHAFQSEVNRRRMLEEGQSVLLESTESATALEKEVKEVQEILLKNNNEIFHLKAEISESRRARAASTHSFECSVDKLNSLMHNNIKQRERETSVKNQLKDISSCSEKFTKDLEKLKQELEEEQSEQEQRLINYETGKSELSIKLIETVERNLCLSKSLENVVSEVDELRDREEQKEKEVERLERRRAEVASTVSQLRSKRDGEVGTLGQMETEKQRVLEKMQSMKSEHEEVEGRLREIIANLDKEINLLGKENMIKDEKKRKLHAELVETDMLEGEERRRLEELNMDLNHKSETLMKQSCKIEEMKIALTHRNLQLDHCLKLISSSDKAQEEHLSKVDSERERLQKENEMAKKSVDLIRKDIKSICKAHEEVLSEIQKTKEGLRNKIAVLNAAGKNLEEKVVAEKDRKQELEDSCEKLKDLNKATVLLHCRAMEAHSLRGKALKEQTDQMSSSLQELRDHEQTLKPVLQDAEDELRKVTTKRIDIEENVNKITEKIRCSQERNENIHQMCTARKEELAILRRNTKLWNELESEYMKRVERKASQLGKQHKEIGAVNKDLQVALDELDSKIEKVDQAREAAPKHLLRLRVQYVQVKRLTRIRRHTYTQLARDIEKMEQQTATDVTKFEKKLRHEEEKLANIETKLREMLINFDEFFNEVECTLHTDSAKLD